MDVKNWTGNLYHFTYNSNSLGIVRGKVRALSLRIAKCRARKLVGKCGSLRRIWEMRE